MLVEVVVTSMLLSMAKSSDLPTLYRTVEKAGFHRELTVRVDIPLEALQGQSNPDMGCHMLFIEEIPSGAYVDPDQLQSLKPFGGPDVYIEDPVDIEKPEFESDRFTVLIFTNISRTETGWSCEYKLPVHLRYHAISDQQDYIDVSFPVPLVAVKCRDNSSGYKGPMLRVKQALCTSEVGQICDWIEIQVNKTSPGVRVKVPVGRLHHYHLITIGTTVATMAGCVFLVYRVTNSHKLKLS